ncbi:glycosyltransferase [Siphonobacter sp. SORGH_AS_0500]|uniref:glycosyltransferase n=1 Tax=Siphonobacter sp. SORGH_AS_0500 TaxID=1864824 RepID=UPI00285AEA56|nr:glycosyltransferase [Siphonobacter sp. SORGH_AS_0500]MDR6193710.1 glycosyltransferase involved in cell wall biosynthesis [Siphonobacter sp. SORGH_AS_0500]
MGEIIIPTIVISAINIFEGGPLTILKECLDSLNKYFSESYHVKVYIHKKELLPDYSNIELIELPLSRKSWLYRVYYEYIYFNRESKKIKPYLWFSLHDTSPLLTSCFKQAVYCHNPSIFYKPSLKELKYDYKHVLFSAFYYFLYKINIKSNDFVVVQQKWIRDEFYKKFLLPIDKIIVAYPSGINTQTTSLNYLERREKITFIYPAFPRVFKNYEVIVEAVLLLNKKGLKNFEVKFTISGNENEYASKIYEQASSIDNIKFLGILPREKLFDEYSKSEILLFPSKLETWGLPLTECKLLNRYIISADLSYARETVGDYENISFFNPDSAEQLASLMEGAINNDSSIWHGNTKPVVNLPFTNNWKQLFDLLLLEN